MYRQGQIQRQTYILETRELPLVDRPRARETDLQLNGFTGWLENSIGFRIFVNKITCPLLVNINLLPDNVALANI